MEQIGKLWVMSIASQLTAGVIANRPDELPLDAQIQDERIKLENLMSWEIFRIFYHGVVKAVDSTDWPAPKITLDAGTLMQSVLPALGNLVPGLDLAALIPQLLTKLFGDLVKPAPADPLPNPGD